MSDYKYDYTRDDILDSLKKRKMGGTNEDFQARTQYYFKDANLMTKKAERYHRIGRPGDDEESLEETKQYAQTYTNRGAYKRKKHARSAEKHFNKAADLINRFDEQGKTPIQIFRHRKAVMAEREQAMRDATVTKSKSDSHEEYLKAKASVSCILTLFDQWNHLSQGLEGREKAEFDREKDLLKARYAECQMDLLRNTPKRDDLWLSKNESAFSERKVKSLRDSKRRNHIEVSEEDAKLALELQKLDEVSGQTLPFERIVLRDMAGAPLNAAEQQKYNENLAFRNAIRAQGDEPTIPPKLLKGMVMRVFRFIGPSPEELADPKMFQKWFTSDLVKNYEMLKKTVKDLNKELTTGNPQLNGLPGLKEKMDYLLSLSDYMDRYLRQHCGIDKNNEQKYDIVQQADKDAVVEVNDNMRDRYVKLATKADSLRAQGQQDFNSEELSPLFQGMVYHSEVPAFDLETQEDKWTDYVHYRMTNPKLKVEDYTVIKGYSNAIKCMYHPALTDIKHSKELSGMYSLGMRCVKYDKNGTPVSPEEAEKHAHMIRWLRTFQQGDELCTPDNQRHAINEELNDIVAKYREFALPSVKELSDGWIENLLTAEGEQDLVKQQN